MKAIATLVLLVLTYGIMLCQNKIELKNGTVIKKAKLFRINSNYIEYEKDGSLHDLLIPEIDRIIMSDTIIVFNMNNEPIYSSEYMRTLISEEIKSDTTIIAPDTIEKSKNQDTANIKSVSTSSEKNCESEYKQRHDFFILLSPLAMIETDPNLKFTGEFVIDKNISMAQTLGICFSNPVSVGAMVGNVDIRYGVVLETELKLYFLNQKNRDKKYYQSFELLFKTVSYNDTYYHYPEDADTYQTFEFDKRKTLLCTSYKLGKLLTYNDFVMDVYIGVGLRVRNIEDYKLRNPGTGQYLLREDFYRHSTRVPMPSLKAGIRLGFGN